jgi:diguanylate cyclase (GGDEF)-like protein
MALAGFEDGLSLLLADDDQADRMIIRRLLRQIDHEQRIRVTEAPDGKSALAALRDGSFDCALVDFYMPGLTGMDIVVAAASGAVPPTPIIMLSGATEEASVVAALRSGAEDYLIKGECTASDLARSIRYSVERFRVRAELAKANALLAHEAVTDPLTGVLNRRGFDRVLPIELARANRMGGLFGIFIDCDDFKSINELHGHAGGDVTLQEIAERLQRTLRPYDHIARVGGDEFLLLISNVGNETALALADRLRDQIASTPIPYGNNPVILATVSMSVFVIPSDMRDISGLLDLARSGIEASKIEGKNRVAMSDVRASGARSREGRG